MPMLLAAEELADLQLCAPNFSEFIPAANRHSLIQRRIVSTCAFLRGFVVVTNRLSVFGMGRRKTRYCFSVLTGQRSGSEGLLMKTAGFSVSPGRECFSGSVNTNVASVSHRYMFVMFILSKLLTRDADRIMNRVANFLAQRISLEVSMPLRERSRMRMSHIMVYFGIGVLSLKIPFLICFTKG